MATHLALNLTHDEIALLHDTGAGWVSLGAAQIAAPDFAHQLAHLRATAARIGGLDHYTTLIIPDTEVLYTSASATGLDAAADAERVRETLDGATPYAVEDLSYDWVLQGDRLRIAVVARDILQEAETFAEDHGFRPVSLTAIPPEGGFDRAPWFGATARAEDIVKGGSQRPAPAPPIAITGTLTAQALESLLSEIEAARAERETTARHPAPATEKEDGPSPAAPDTAAAPQRPAQDTPADARPDADAPAAQNPAGTATGADDTGSAGAAQDDTTQDAAPVAPTFASRRPGALPPQAPPSGNGATPETPSPRPATGTAAAQDSAPVAFSSIRPRRAAQADAPRTASATGPDSAAGFARAAGPTLAARRGDANPPESEAESLTVFGARPGQQQVGAEPGRAGLLVTGALILVLVLLGIWAGIAYRDQIAAWLNAPPPETAIATLPAARDSPPPHAAPPPTAPDPDPPTGTAAAPERPPDTAPAVTATLRATPALPGVTAAPAPPSANAAQDAQDIQPARRIPLPLGTAPPPGPTTLARLPDPPPQADPAAIADLADAEPEIVALTPQEVRERYAATGIWQSPPPQPASRGETGIDRLFLAAIDPVIPGADAVDLPRDPRRLRDSAPPRQANPPAPGIDILLGADGLVTPTPGGTLNPDGILVYAGPPPTGAPPRRPGLADAPTGIAGLQPGMRPRQRPAALSDTIERTRFGGRTREELATLRPLVRPDSVTETAAALRAEARDMAARAAQDMAVKQRAEAEAAGRAGASPLAITVSLSPRQRPAGLAPATREDGGTQDSAPRTVQPSIPTSVSVARQATVDNGLRLNQVNLIGIFGTPNDRRALVRLPSGRLLRLKVGDRLDGGRVGAIGEAALRYTKGGRDYTLQMPRG